MVMHGFNPSTQKTEISVTLHSESRPARVTSEILSQKGRGWRWSIGKERTLLLFQRTQVQFLRIYMAEAVCTSSSKESDVFFLAFLGTRHERSTHTCKQITQTHKNKQNLEGKDDDLDWQAHISEYIPGLIMSGVVSTVHQFTSSWLVGIWCQTPANYFLETPLTILSVFIPKPQGGLFASPFSTKPPWQHFFLAFIYLFVCFYFVCMNVLPKCLCTMCMQCPWNPAEASGSLNLSYRQFCAVGVGI